MNPVIIDGCDSGVENHIFEDGCTISDRIAACAAGARNHGELVSCVAHLTNNLSVVDLSPAKKRVPADSAYRSLQVPVVYWSPGSLYKNGGSDLHP